MNHSIHIAENIDVHASGKRLFKMYTFVRLGVQPCDLVVASDMFIQMSRRNNINVRICSDICSQTFLINTK